MDVNYVLVIVTLLGRKEKENASILTNIITHPNEVKIGYPFESKILTT